MSKYPALTPGINSQTGSAEFRNQMLQAFRGVDSRFLVTPGVINTYVTPISNSGSTETTVLTIPIGSDYLAKVGTSILTFAAGNFAANGNNKTLKFKLNTSGSTTVLFTIGPTAFNAISWTAQWEIIRSGASSQFSWLQFFAGTTANIQTNNGTVDLSGGGTIVITATGVASADAVLSYAKTQLLTT